MKPLSLIARLAHTSLLAPAAIAALAAVACTSGIPAPSRSATAADSANAPAASTDVGAPCAPKTEPFDAKKFDLTGPWADEEGGIYYLRQLGNIVWWNGMSSRADPAAALGREWNNVARGVITDLTITVEWASVPRAPELASGTLTLSIGPDSSGNIHLTETAYTGSHWGNSLTPCAPG